jgi:predicted nucleic-acid-binding Zn-ribbon protein
MSKGDLEAFEVVCPKCRRPEIVYLSPEKNLCPKCRIQMAFKEVLTEGKAY